MNIKNWLGKDELKEIILMVISAISLITGFIKPDLLFFDLSWIAVILCGLPIIREAIESLIHEKDIKADLLVSIAIISSIIIGEVFCCRSNCFNHDYWRIFRRIHCKQNSEWN